MISQPIYDNFLIRLDREFLLPEIQATFGQYYHRFFDFQYVSLVDYVNSTILNFTIPGMKTQVQTQTNNGERGRETGTKRTYAGGLNVRSSVDKRITIEFKVQNNFFTYQLLRRQLEYFINRKNNNPKFFLPPIYTALIDDYGQMIYEQTMHDVVMASISDITMKKNDVAVQYKSFQCDFYYNRVEEIDCFSKDFIGIDGINKAQQQTNLQKTSYKA